MRLSVLVPTYRRPVDFERCLQGLDSQQRRPDEVIVVIRDIDEESREVLARWQNKPYLRVVEVRLGGQVTALNAGLSAVTGEIVMITDDDAIPHNDWCRRVEEHFIRDPMIGGIGGRDIVYATEGLLTGHCKVTGRVQPWGRVVGNHHLIAPAMTYVDILKGANMSYRMSAIRGLRFDTDLRGAGAQVGNDMAFSLAVASRGWRLLYDPAVQVNHYPSQRFDNDIRGVLNLEAVENVSFNRWWILQHHLKAGPRRSMAMLWESILGTNGHPGWLRGAIAIARRDQRTMQVWTAAHKGRRAAIARSAELRRKGTS
ncbi:glycosyltransferase family 2 protein [Silvibacterium dinghuense]|uniref:Glycosyltransferase n=1 Tax=Silvibacterium dinghuense TaxID=1560006 RepID=A0A4Q1SCI5_9BACT|nr:glycosyltransferase [Silvibacterium dinghuense]RXS94942.1 glycosyltransferase [Silvibacterium dinghuense]